MNPLVVSWSAIVLLFMSCLCANAQEGPSARPNSLKSKRRHPPIVCGYLRTCSNVKGY